MGWSCNLLLHLHHISLPHVSLPQDSSSGNNMLEMSSFRPDLLNYSNGQPTDLSSWDRAC